LLWQLEQAPLIIGILPQLKRGVRLPPKIADRPELDEGDALFWNAYVELSSDRNSSGAIPWSSRVRWAERYGLDEIQTQALIDIIGAMDKTYMQWRAKK
jgi:hypothetical protein